MPRAKVDPALRKRVARACDLCRKRKEKCTGGDPCPQCRERGTEDQCQYTPVHKTPYSPRPGQEASVVDEVSSNEGSPAAFKQRQRVVIAATRAENVKRDAMARNLVVNVASGEQVPLALIRLLLLAKLSVLLGLMLIFF